MLPYAAHTTRGRKHPEPAPTSRSEFQRDRDRIIHSGAFRRLEYKTQVFINHEGDLYRTRLTHSLEVAQVARACARTLSLNEDLVEAICLAHDLGHTPFGHAGQDALNACMKPFGGFEHNAQSLRVVDDLEDKYASFTGLNLLFETREGILKHCSKTRAAALGEVGQRFLQGQQPSLEAQLANVADEIAYNHHDLEDGLRAGLISFQALQAVPLFARHWQATQQRFPHATPKQQRFETLRSLLGEMIGDLLQETQARLTTVKPDSIEAVRAHSARLVGFSETMAAENRALKQFLMKNLYQHPQVFRVMNKAQRVVAQLFERFFEEARLLPPHFQARCTDDDSRARAIADYIAGMTDRYAIDEHERLFDLRRLR
jgi:dGTPase